MTKIILKMENNHEKIYVIIDDDYLYESEVKFTKEFLTKFKAEFNIPQFIPHNVKKNIQQVGLEYWLFSHIVKIKIEVVVVVEKSFKANQKNSNWGKMKFINKNDSTKLNHSDLK